MKACLACGSPDVSALIDFGRQAVCNRFLSSPADDEQTFPLGLGVCTACGIVQLLAPLPAEELRPRVDWLTCTEPEGHLDDLATTISRLPGLGRTATICGVSFKDDTLLQRLQRLGPYRTWRIDPAVDLGIVEPCAGIETLQARLTPERAASAASRNGAADVVIARHVFEHATDPTAFAAALGRLVVPGGHVVIEVPDCQRALELCDYTTVWEEHSLYFTPRTFLRTLETRGYTIRQSSSVPYPLEDSLIAIATPAPSAGHDVDQEHVAADVRIARRFADSFADRSAAVVGELGALHRRHGRIAVFGAGHLACTFINLMGVARFVDCVLDDNPHKVGLYMPGSRLPIVPSQTLLDREISLCLLSIGAGGEHNVIDKQRAFVDRGGSFRSIFPSSRLALGS